MSVIVRTAGGKIVCSEILTVFSNCYMTLYPAYKVDIFNVN